MIDSLYEFLASLGFDEPLHPPITHMPIGLAVGAFIFFLTAIIFKIKRFQMTARHASILAFIFAFPTILLGVLDRIHFYHAALLDPIKIKMILAVFLLIVLGTGIIVGSEIKIRSVTMAVLYALAFITVLGLGYFGARLIYDTGQHDNSSVLFRYQDDAGQAFLVTAGTGELTEQDFMCPFPSAAAPGRPDITAPETAIRDLTQPGSFQTEITVPAG